MAPQHIDVTSEVNRHICVSCAADVVSVSLGVEHRVTRCLLLVTFDRRSLKVVLWSRGAMIAFWSPAGNVDVTVLLSGDTSRQN